MTRGGRIAWARWGARTGARVLRTELGTELAPAAGLDGGTLDGEGGGNNVPHPGWGLRVRPAGRARPR